MLSGLLADRVGSWAPFAAGAAFALPVTVFFALQGSPEAVARPVRGRCARAAARGAAHRNRMVVYAMLATVLLGFVGGMGNLLGSLRLSENGLSPSGIGLLFSVGALVWIVVAPLAGRLGEQRSHVALTAVGCALLGVAWLVPVADRSTTAIAAFLLASMAGRAGLNTFSYLLAGSGAESAGAGRGTVIGLVNLSWGVAAVIGPLAASAAHGNIDDRVPFGVIAALCLGVAALLFAGRRPARTLRAEERARRRLKAARPRVRRTQPEEPPARQVVASSAPARTSGAWCGRSEPSRDPARGDPAAARW